MIPAIIEIHQSLVKSGYSEEDADALTSRFLEEEASDYIKLINELENHLKKENTIFH